jgi:flavorubredoxin
VETRTDEIAENIFRLSTYIPEANLPFNQYLVRAEEPLLFHTGMRALFPLVSDAASRIIPVDELRWITFGHVEADECGAMNHFLAAAPRATVAHGALACMVQVGDWADRPPRPLADDGEVLDLGGARIRTIETPHVPHGWDAHVLYEEVTGTLLCGDLFTQPGDAPATTSADIVEPALAFETMGATALTPATAPTIRGLADRDVNTLALMHGPAFEGDCTGALHSLADGYAELFEGARSRNASSNSSAG